MFQRYNEKARRVILFSREEASEFGCEAIEADFILLGIAREEPSLCVQWLGANYPELREIIARLYTRDKQIPTSVDLPLLDTARRVLAHAAEEADRLADSNIGTEHLFLGLLREDGTAPKLLKARGEDVKNVRVAIAQEPRHSNARLRTSSPGIQMKLVTEDGGEVAVIAWQGWTPRIGEAIRVPNGEDEETTYRVRDLCSRISDAGDSILRASEILLTLRKERS